MEILYPALLVLALLISAAGGMAAQRKLREHYVGRESVESVRLLMGMLLTFAALVLGLLTSSAKGRFDGYNNDFSVFGADLIELDHRLRVYGPGADEIRAMLRSYTAAAIADTWKREPPPPGQYPRFGGTRGVERGALGDLLADVDVQIGHLAPTDEFHRLIAARLRDRVATTIQQRWRLIFEARSTISWPFLLILTSWLLIVFAIFGLTAPRNMLVYAVVALAALSIASPLYLIIDYSQTLLGLEELSSVPMRTALSHMDQAN